MTESSLQDRVALVTGGSRGIGKAIALALAAAGCDVAVNYLTREADARTTADAIRALGRRAVPAPGDVAKSADVAAIVGAAESYDMIPVGRFGRVEECADVMVMLAGNAYITGQPISVNGGPYLAS